MKCIIIEDQPPAQRILQKYIEDLGTLDLVGTFSDALQALEFLKSNTADLIFLDIHLPKMSGIDFLRTISNPPAVILTTAFADYALESYDLDVVDYLLKPFSFQRFVKSVAKVPKPEERDSKSSDHIAGRSSEIFIKSGYEHIRLHVEDIVFIRSDSDYTELVTQDKKLLSNESLRYWLEYLPRFVQTHKSYLINSTHIEKIAGNQIYLKGKHVVPIGRAYKESLVKRFLR